jgi:hypothetical protein
MRTGQIKQFCENDADFRGHPTLGRGARAAFFVSIFPTAELEPQRSRVQGRESRVLVCDFRAALIPMAESGQPLNARAE